jgi:hypothetical protein
LGRMIKKKYTPWFPFFICPDKDGARWFIYQDKG